MPEVPIKGIENIAKGVKLSDDAYQLTTILEGFRQYHEPIDDKEATGLQVKILQKDSTVYVLVAGTNDKLDVMYNWPTKGKVKFNELDKVLPDIINSAKANEWNVAVIGDMNYYWFASFVKVSIPSDNSGAKS